MAQTITVSSTVNLSAKTYSPPVTLIDFTNILGTSATATFSAAQFGNQPSNSISSSAVVDGSDGFNRLIINVTGSNASELSLTFSNWAASDMVVIYGSAAADTIYGVGIGERIYAGDGDDSIWSSTGADRVFAGNGNDTVIYEFAADTAGDILDGGAGVADMLYCGTGGTFNFRAGQIANFEIINTVPLFGGDQTLLLRGDQIGGPGKIGTIQSGDSSATLLDVAGTAIDISTVIFSNWDEPQDTIILRAGRTASTLVGGAQSETFFGSGGNDSFTGNGGSNVFNSSLGVDSALGGTGDDTFQINSQTHVATGETYNGGGGSDVLKLGTPVTRAGSFDFQGATVTNIEKLQFTAGGTAIFTSDPIYVGAGGIGEIIGSAATDTLRIVGPGLDLADLVFTNWVPADLIQLIGDGGDNVINATVARDQLTGNGGADEFSFTDAAHAGNGRSRDAIMDFTQGVDVINLSVIDADGSVKPGDGTFALIETAFTGAGAELRAVKSSDLTFVILTADIDGNKIADFQIEVKGNVDFTLADFVM